MRDCDCYIRIVVLMLMLLVTGSGSQSWAGDDVQFVRFTKQSLQAGRQIWIGNCKTCHAYGTAGAPVPMEVGDWQSRLFKPRQVLYDHAIHGYYGQDDTIMPARGGNPELTDKQVRQAVDYMVRLAEYYISQQSR